MQYLVFFNHFVAIHTFYFVYHIKFNKILSSNVNNVYVQLMLQMDNIRYD